MKTFVVTEDQYGCYIEDHHGEIEAKLFNTDLYPGRAEVTIALWNYLESLKERGTCLEHVSFQSDPERGEIRIRFNGKTWPPESAISREGH